jgi:hypothetical protein
MGKNESKSESVLHIWVTGGIEESIIYIKFPNGSNTH